MESNEYHFGGPANSGSSVALRRPLARGLPFLTADDIFADQVQELNVIITTSAQIALKSGLLVDLGQLICQRCRGTQRDSQSAAAHQATCGSREKCSGRWRLES